MLVAIDGTSLVGARTGVGTVVEAMVSGLAAAPEVDLTVFVVSRRAGKELVTHLPPRVGFTRLALPARLCHRLWRHVDYPRLRGFEVVHGPNFVVPPAGGGAELVTIHDLTPWRFPELASPASAQFPALVARALRRGAHVHTPSRAVAEEVIEQLGVSSERVHPIPNGVAPPGPSTAVPSAAVPSAIAPAASPTGGRPYILALGTIEPRKDLPTLVRALALLRSTHPDVALVVAGPDGWGTEDYEAAVAATGTAEAIIRLGYVDEAAKADLIAGAAVFAYPSRYEGFGLPPLEAAARGVPVVATRVGAIAEVMGDAAVLVEVGDVEGLAQALTLVLDDETERQRLSQAGPHQAARFPWSSSIAQLIALYHRLGDYQS